MATQVFITGNTGKPVFNTGFVIPFPPGSEDQWILSSEPIDPLSNFNLTLTHDPIIERLVDQKSPPCYVMVIDTIEEVVLK